MYNLLGNDSGIDHLMEDVNILCIDANLEIILNLNIVMVEHIVLDCPRIWFYGGMKNIMELIHDFRIFTCMMNLYK